MDSAKLTKSHAVYRGQVTKLQNKYNNIFAQAEHTEDDQDSLVATLESIREKLEIITKLGTQIQELASDDDLELVESDDYVTSVREYLVKSEFVSNRIKAIRALDISDYKYCPTLENPADLVSRGVSNTELSSSELWWRGPSWLPLGDWPICQIFDSAVLSVMTDLTANSESNSTSTPSVTVPSADLTFMNPSDYSSLKKLLRVTVYVLRFVQCLRDRKRSSVSLPSADELSNAEKFWILRVQREHYTKELSALRNNDIHTSLTKQLRLFLDNEGILRVGGRLHNAPLMYNTQFPTLLPSSATYTKLLILDTHQRAKHMGTESTLTLLRQNYWVTKTRRTVKSVLRTCFQCKLINGLPYALPPSAPLKECRLRNSPPFTVTGIDYTGALYVRSNSLTGKTESKAYLLLFTCASSRAVHLEVTTDLTVASFINAFRRFVARRSLPSKLLSDNATTFLSANNELQKLLSSSNFQNFMTDHRMTWTNIPKCAPWHGGFWERLIGLTKTTIKKVLGRAFVTLDELTTIVTEVETTINNRPLTYLSSDINDLTPLTPSHLLHGRLLTTLPHMQVDDNDLSDTTFASSRNELTKRANRLATIQDQFWKRWANEYLTALRECHLQAQRATQNSNNPIKIGDVVLVHDTSKQRVNWDLALVTDVVKGNDGLVRSAKIKARHGITNRPINKLYLLEILSPNVSDSLETQSVNISDPAVNPSSRYRTPRKAGLEASERIQIMSNDYDS